MGKRRVLVTGAAGYVAAQMLPAFRERFDCTLVDVRDTDRDGEQVPGIRVVDLLRDDIESLRPLFRDMDAVIHIGYIHPAGGMGSRSWDAYYAERDNVDLAFRVYQLSHQEGVRRVVVASSNHAADWYEHLVHMKERDIVGPWERAVSDNFYGWAKEAYEHLGFVFASGGLGRQLEVVQLRIGAPREIDPERFTGDPVGYHRDLGAWISARDMTQLFVKSVEAEEIRDLYGVPFQIFYGISDNLRKFWSIANARQVIGYAPEDDSEIRYAADIRRHLIPLGAPIPAGRHSREPGTR